MFACEVVGFKSLFGSDVSDKFTVPLYRSTVMSYYTYVRHLTGHGTVTKYRCASHNDVSINDGPSTLVPKY